MSKCRYIIYALSYKERSGGAIVLHYLCDRLNALGEEAYVRSFLYPVFPNLKKCSLKDAILQLIYYIVRYGLLLLLPFKTNKVFNTPIYTKRSVRDSDIVIYPEILDNNPLKAKNVVRWLLNKPGFFTNRTQYGKDDLFFTYQKAFTYEALYDGTQTLKVFWLHPLYKQSNFGSRSGTCYMLRKEKRPIVHDLEGSICLDGASHERIVDVFNQTLYFISYDVHTMYSRYAAMCGCIPIVIPREGITKEVWRIEENYRLGIAYGFEDIPYAIETRQQLLDSMKAEQEDMDRQLKDFIYTTKEKFLK